MTMVSLLFLSFFLGDQTIIDTWFRVAESASGCYCLITVYSANKKEPGKKELRCAGFTQSNVVRFVLKQTHADFQSSVYYVHGYFIHMTDITYQAALC